MKKNSFLSKYGSYTIPAGTIFFRDAPNKCIYDTMFFGFCTTGAGTANYSSQKTQVWETLIPIHSFFMVKGRANSGEFAAIYSAIVDIQNHFFPKSMRDPWDDVLLKQTNNVHRRRLVTLFKKHGFTSWVCSAEDNYVMEVFSFGGEALNKQSFRYVKSIKTWDDEYQNTNSFDYGKTFGLPCITKPFQPGGFPFWDEEFSPNF